LVTRTDVVPRYALEKNITNKRNPIKINPYKSLFDDTASEISQSAAFERFNASQDNLLKEPVNKFYKLHL
jgi:hypothetical protein